MTTTNPSSKPPAAYPGSPLGLSDLAGRVALVTGASAGIGHAVAADLSRRGARVVINARRADRLAHIADELNAEAGHRSDQNKTPPVVPVAGDCADENTINQMLAAAKSNFGASPDLVVINAGRGLSGSVLTSDTAQWEEMVRTNLLGASRLLRSAAIAMRQNAQQQTESNPDAWLTTPRDIVILGSTVGRHISPFSSMYGSTKFAVHSLAEAARRELANTGIRVTVIAPGVVRSEFQSVAGYDPKKFGDFMDQIGPVLHPNDIARLIAFVCSQPAAVSVNDIVIRPTRQEYP